MFMNAEDTVKIYCPAYLANGGAMAYSQLGTSRIEPNTPMIFELKVLECQSKVDDILAINKRYFNKPPGNVVQSGLKSFSGD